MAISLSSITTEAQTRAPRIVLLGVEKIGKSSFACGSTVENGHVVSYGANDPVVISVKGEEGTDAFPVAKFPVAKTFEDVIDEVAAIYREDHPYKTVVIDSASALEPVIWDKLCRDTGAPSIEKVGGGFGKGYIEAVNLWRKLLVGLDALREKKNMASIIIGHVKVKSVNNPDTDLYDAYQFDINDRASNLLYRWADLILFANVKVAVKKSDDGVGEKARAIDITNGQRFLYTQKRPSHPGGGRGIYGALPYELPFDWTSFMAAVRSLTTNK